MNAFNFEQLKASDRAQKLSSTKYGSAERAFITLELSEIRYRYDGGEPTATEGHLLHEGGFLVLNGIQQIESFKFIKSNETEAILSISYERE